MIVKEKTDYYIKYIRHDITMYLTKACKNSTDNHCYYIDGSTGSDTGTGGAAGRLIDDSMHQDTIAIIKRRHSMGGGLKI